MKSYTVCVKSMRVVKRKKHRKFKARRQKAKGLGGLALGALIGAPLALGGGVYQSFKIEKKCNQNLDTAV